MRSKYSWKDLVGEPPLCKGGRLASIVFCCDPRRKYCPILEDALKMLGVSRDEFIRIMDEYRIPIPEKDGTCFGNLAFCPSPEVPSRDREEGLLKIGWSLSRFLKYKFELLRKLVSPDKLDYAFNTRVLNQFAVEILDLETKKVYKGFALGNIKSGTLVVTEIFSENELRDEQVSVVLSQTEFVGVRIPKDLLNMLDELVASGVVESRSDGIRRALMLYLGALKPVKQGVEVKP